MMAQLFYRLPLDEIIDCKTGQYEECYKHVTPSSRFNPVKAIFLKLDPSLSLTGCSPLAPPEVNWTTLSIVPWASVRRRLRRGYGIKPLAGWCSNLLRDALSDPSSHPEPLQRECSACAVCSKMSPVSQLYRRGLLKYRLYNQDKVNYCEFSQPGKWKN